jgi:ribonucleoside-diphosphate reductase alpha chain
MTTETLTTKNTLSKKAQEIVAKRYSLKDSNGNPVEIWEDICRRVSNAVMGQSENREALHNLMLSTVFVPNTPCLVNAGKPDGQLAACFVLHVPDSIDGIMEHAQIVANIHKSGGGTGMSYEFLRPHGMQVSTSGGTASGPVSFMEIVNKVTEVVKQGGVRRGANMGIMSIKHPDVLRFIHAKNDQTTLTNFNISVTVTDDFMTAVKEKRWFQLEFDGKPWDKPIFDPVTGKDYALFFNEESIEKDTEFDDAKMLSFIDCNDYQSKSGQINEMMEAPAGQVYAPDIWNRIVASAHKYAEPGVIFIDQVNRSNYLKNTRGLIYSCNPCGEEFLHATNSCNLGSIDVSKFISEDKTFDQEGFKAAVFLAVEFLDNVVDASVWTTPEIDATVKATRPVGLGLMGIGDALIKLEIAYGSDDAIDWIETLTDSFQKISWEASFKLGREKGVFPEYEANRVLYEDFFYDLFDLVCQCEGPNETYPEGSRCGNHDFTPRNYEVTTIAPTGTISLIAGCSSGIEPNFDFSYVREDTISKSGIVHPLAAKFLGIEYDENDEESVYNAAKEVSDRRGELPHFFVGAMDITALQHVKMLAAAQKHIDNSISKTCNGANDDTVESVANLYLQAYELGCKAVSYYRDGSRDNQVLSAVKTEEKKAEEIQPEAVQQNNIVKEKPQRVFKRPAALSGRTYRFPVGGAFEYFTINKDEDGNIVEVFNSGGNVSASVGLLMSKMIQSGCFDTEELARTLDKSKGEFSIPIEGRYVTSPEQAFAHLLRVESGNALSAKDKINGLNTQPVGGNQVNGHAARNTVPMYACPECHEKALVKESGCESCKNCHYSRC